MGIVVKQIFSQFWCQPRHDMDPSWPYMPSNALYLPFGAMNQNISGPQPSIGQQETVHHQFYLVPSLSHSVVT